EVYGPGLCCAFGVLTALLSAARTGRVGFVWFAWWLAGFGLGVHYFLATLGLGYVLMLFAAARRIRPDYGDYSVATVMFMFGSTVFVLLPLRAALGAPLNFGDPRTWERFVWVVSGGTYGQFFGVPTLERLEWFLILIVDTLTPLGVVLALVGVAVC